MAAALGSAVLAALASSWLQMAPPPPAASKSVDISPLPRPEFEKPVPETYAEKADLPSGRKQESGAQRPLQVAAASEPAGQSTTQAGAIEKQSGVKVVRAGGEGAPDALVIDVAKALSATTADADPRITEPSRYGPVPRIGMNGARPSKVYARPASLSAGRPRIALVVGGLGLAERATESTISTLPGEVTLGFAPYGSDLSRKTALARGAGHEVVLQIPMEPFDYPRENPGPHALLAGAGEAANIDNLTWLMSRFTGYAGVMNFLGGRFMADERASNPVLREIARRGLFYLDDGSSSQTITVPLAANRGLAAARADIVVDGTAQPEAIEAALARLEAIARERGVAIGVASALPASIAAIGRFARALESRGISLIPLSAAMPNQRGRVADSSPTR
jgi:polysaccharide deacetylase 2 family uncharacterized protein YibQ